MDRSLTEEIVIKDEKFCNISCTRRRLKELGHDSKNFLDQEFILTMQYFYSLHSTSLFHGDIKPANVFTPVNLAEEQKLLADIDSVVLLDGPQDDNEPAYLGSSWTRGFSSAYYVKTV